MHTFIEFMPPGFFILWDRNQYYLRATAKNTLYCFAGGIDCSARMG